MSRGHIQRGELVRLLPHWHADAGAISLYYPSRTLMPAKTGCSLTSWSRRFTATARG
jgi:DNA-binding transcriptional LysR family regulator